MNVDVLTTRAADGIGVTTLGSANRIYLDAEMGDALSEALDGFAGDPNVRVVIVTGGAPGYCNFAFGARIVETIKNRFGQFHDRDSRGVSGKGNFFDARE